MKEEVPLPDINQESGPWAGWRQTRKGSQSQPAAPSSLSLAKVHPGVNSTAKGKGVGGSRHSTQSCLERVEERMKLDSQEVLQEGCSRPGEVAQQNGTR